MCFLFFWNLSWIEGGDGLYLVVDERGNFRENNFQKALSSLSGTTLDSVQTDAVIGGSENKGTGLFLVSLTLLFSLSAKSAYR
tara:strand:- start:1614 stop:1862 length:249 start_codon:yes stop_codon:yes gene_type:complete